jgi:hypothetical protein
VSEVVVRYEDVANRIRLNAGIREQQLESACGDRRAEACVDDRPAVVRFMNKNVERVGIPIDSFTDGAEGGLDALAGLVGSERRINAALAPEICIEEDECPASVDDGGMDAGRTLAGG